MRHLIRHIHWQLVLLAALAPRAMAQARDQDWVKPATDLISNLESGLIQVGAPVIGLAIIGFGIWSAATGRIEWAKLWIYVIAGLLITAGPATIRAVLPDSS